MGIIGGIRHGIEKLDDKFFESGSLKSGGVKSQGQLFEASETESPIVGLTLELTSKPGQAANVTGSKAEALALSTEKLTALNGLMSASMDNIQDASSRLRDVCLDIQSAALSLSELAFATENALNTVLSIQNGEAPTLEGEEEEPESGIMTFEQANAAYERALLAQEEAMAALEEQQRRADEIQAELDGYSEILNGQIGQYQIVQGEIDAVLLSANDDDIDDVDTKIDGINEQIRAFDDKLGSTQDIYDKAQAGYYVANLIQASHAVAAANYTQQVAEGIGVTRGTDENGNPTVSAPKEYSMEDLAVARMLNEVISNPEIPGSAIPSNKEEMLKYSNNFELNKESMIFEDDMRSFEYVDKETGERFLIQQTPDEYGEWHTTTRTRISETGGVSIEFLAPDLTNGNMYRYIETGSFDENHHWNPETRTTFSPDRNHGIREYLNEGREEVGQFDENGNWTIDKEYTGDGIIDYTQQGDVGDCWLLNNLSQLSLTEWGRNAIEDVVKLDDKGNYTITFKGHEPIYLTKDELDDAQDMVNENGATRYSSGDRDTLAIEVAVERLEGVELDGGNASKFLDLFFGHNDETGKLNIDGTVYGRDEYRAELVNIGLDSILGSINGTDDELDDETIVEFLDDIQNIMNEQGTQTEGYNELREAIISYLNLGGSTDDIASQIDTFKGKYADRVQLAKINGNIVSADEDIDRAFSAIYEEYTSGNITHLNEVGIYVGDGGHSVSIRGFETGDDGKIYVLYNNPWDSSETYKDTWDDFRAMTGMVTTYARLGNKQNAQFTPNDTETHGSSWSAEGEPVYSEDGKTASYQFIDKNNGNRRATVEIDIATGRKIRETITNGESTTVKDYESKIMTYDGPAGNKPIMKMGEYDVWEYI